MVVIALQNLSSRGKSIWKSLYSICFRTGRIWII
jgi:hypothetical protein